MKNKEPEVMQNLRKIRAEFHEETKNLSDEEWLKKVKEEAAACKKEFGIKLPKRVKIKE